MNPNVVLTLAGLAGAAVVALLPAIPPGIWHDAAIAFLAALSGVGVPQIKKS